jgi:hypothetical protein
MSQDRELDKYLEGKSALSRLYADSPEIELPGHLDAAILAEAHRAVGARPGKPKRRWTIPLGMVATLFVAVMIGLQLPALLKDADQSQQLRQEKMAALMDQRSAEPASVELEERRKSREMAKANSGFSRSETMPKRAAPAPEPEASPQAPAAGLHSLEEQAPVPARAEKSVELRERTDVDSGAAPAKEKKTAGHAAAADSESVALPAPAAATMAIPQAVPMERSLNKDESVQRPEDWLSRIKKLKQQGKLEEAGKELAAFKKRYPNFPVPASLEPG